MIPTYKVPYRAGELRIGWASWDDGSLTDRSIKYAYRDDSGKISRGSPELPFDTLLDMLVLATEQGEIGVFEALPVRAPIPVGTLTKADIATEKRDLISTLLVLQKLIQKHPWAEFGAVYDQIGARYENVKTECRSRNADCLGRK